MLEQYGPFGLVVLAASASVMFLISMEVVIFIKKLFIAEWRFKWMRYALTIPIYWLFMLEGVYVSTVVMNLLVSLSPLLTQAIIVRATLVCAYFACVTALTMSQMKQLPRL
jgi:hypothetical protein